MEYRYDDDTQIETITPEHTSTDLGSLSRATKIEKELSGDKTERPTRKQVFEALTNKIVPNITTDTNALYKPPKEYLETTSKLNNEEPQQNEVKDEVQAIKTLVDVILSVSSGFSINPIQALQGTGGAIADGAIQAIQQTVNKGHSEIASTVVSNRGVIEDYEAKKIEESAEKESQQKEPQPANNIDSVEAQERLVSFETLLSRYDEKITKTEENKSLSHAEKKDENEATQKLKEKDINRFVERHKKAS